jgi:predicted porin
MARIKMTVKNTLLGLCGSLACVSALHAQVYTEVQYMSAHSHGTVSTGTTESRGDTLSGVVGYQLTDVFSVEGLLGTGLGGADVKLNGASQTHPVTSHLDHAVGIYVRAKHDLNKDTSVFAKFGWNDWRTTASNSVASATSSYSDFAYGVGLNYQITQSTYLTTSWMSVYNKNSVKVDGFAIGMGYRY